ncbi:MAG: AraC family ligand binding domain-containing protein, partial [Clostridia bacterium]|nr:AraC family ligand binding domain-containing protein [Clostridia bacterium]
MRNETVRNNVAENMIHVGQPRLHKIGAISELHYHDEIELLLVESGTLGCVCDGVVYEAKEGDVVFINSRVPHSTHVIDDAVIGLIQFKTSHFTPREIPSIIK